MFTKNILRSGSQSRRAAEPQSRRAAVNHSLIILRMIVLTMVIFINMFFSVNSSAQQTLCCRYYIVSLDTLENCCILVKVENIDPNCHGAHVFQYYNPITQQYETKHVEHDEAFYSEFLLCPENGESNFVFRFRLTQHDNLDLPYCIGYPHPYDFVDGFTEWNFEYDASACCDCPDETDSTWWNLKVGPNPNLCPEGCAVMHSLNIPDSITCYHYYYYDNITQGIWSEYPPKSLENDPISQFDGCILPGESSHAYISLLRYPDDPNPCILSKLAVCDTTPLPDTISIILPKPCLPDCQNPTNWDYRVAIYASDICPGCDIQVNYVTRKCDGLQQLEILALVRKNFLCELCDKNLLMKEAFGKIIQSNPMQFKPLINGDCDTTWQVGSGSCWATYPSYYMRKYNPLLDPTMGDPHGFVLDSVMVSVMCDSTDCCISQITICKDSTGLHVMNNQLPDLFLMCGYKSINIWGTLYFCVPNCNWMLIIGDFYPFIINKVDSRNYNPDSEFINNQTGNAIYSKESINLEEYVQRDKHTEIKFFNLHGSLIFSREFTNANKQFDLNTLNLNSGVYFYSILVDGKIVKTEKLIIVK